jgi:indolepyruvate ferredoxin oxidoreductase
MAANMFTLGSAFQAGLLPLSAAALEQAIKLNGTAVAQNLQAFRYGRLAYHDPARVESMAAGTNLPTPMTRFPDDPRIKALTARCSELDSETRRVVGVRVAELADYQSVGYAATYIDAVLEVAEVERTALGADCSYAVTREVGRNLHKLMAYKDEYEVARLHLRAAMEARASAVFETPVRVRYLLHPPFLRALGLKRKIELGQWFKPAFMVLRSLKVLRGSPVDPFGWPRIRREERRLPSWYLDLVRRALVNLSAQTADLVLAVAKIPDGIRGYEEIKLRSIDRADRQAKVVIGLLERGRSSLNVIRK